MFTTSRPLPGITHITDAMGVSFTLAEGRERAILFDTGYGTQDVRTFVSTLTGKPLTVLLSHGHHDHMLGARWFPETWLCEEDLEEFRLRSGEEQRTKVKQQAENGGVPVPDDFLTAVIPEPRILRFDGKTGPFDSLTVDLGGMTARVIRVPGHTPGSIVVFFPEAGLLLTGDDWNPCTWMWFPTSLSAAVWRDNMKTLIRTLEEGTGTEIRHVLCSHQPMIREGKELKEFLAYMTDERMKEAPAADMGSTIRTHQVTEEGKGWTLIFDRDKI